jgi:hypothetical protein
MSFYVIFARLPGRHTSAVNPDMEEAEELFLKHGITHIVVAALPEVIPKDIGHRSLQRANATKNYSRVSLWAWNKSKLQCTPAVAR